VHQKQKSTFSKPFLPDPPYGISGACDSTLAGDKSRRLDTWKTHPRERYDETHNRLPEMAFDPETLSEETLQQIEEGIADIRAGRLRSREDITQELGLK